jgi:hypothetical protein
MNAPLRRLAGLFVCALLAGVGTACGSSGSGSQFLPGVDASADDATVTGDASPGADAGDDGISLIGDDTGVIDAPHVLDVQPSALQTITVTAGQTMPTVSYQATLDGQPIKAGWSVDRGDLGSIAAGPSAQGVFQPTGTTGGLVNVVAGLNGQTLQRQVFVQITGQQNGANPSAPGEGAQIPTGPGDLGSGGGVGGVGGEGLGPPVTDPGTSGALQNPSGNGQAQGLALLYPYDQTVFPRGLLAPLLQWTWSTGDADAIQIQLKTTSGSFSWTGTFARPQILQQTGGKFIRHPIPQDVWAMATNTAGGATPNKMPDQLIVSLVVAKGGQGYGPITETWTVAPGRLAGTIYYNSYGTHLVQNSIEHSYNNGPQFGAAVLGIKGGATGPTVVAGTASALGSGAGCRVCHVVSTDGSELTAQHGDVYFTSSRYDLKNTNAETILTGYDNLFGWAGLSPDGKLAFTNAADLAATSGAATSALFPFPPTSTTPLAATGISANLQAGTPAFSPDMKHVAFDFLGGSIGSATGNGSQLVAMDFDANAKAFSNLRVLAAMPSSNNRAGFPSFFPTNDAVAFHYQIVPSGHRYNTWHQATAQVWWSDLATAKAMPLYALNGLNAAGTGSTIPTGANNHANDTVLNYEPTVNPVSSGGYIWIIFTSRRLYGSVATTDPWQSDPRDYDATVVGNATTKKLWVAAIDLNAKAGTDPSHPAFYLPAQELLAGNARGFWVLDPCKPDGQTCQSGDQCCNGYCEPGADGGLVCTNTPPNAHCSKTQEKCTTAADCCDMTNQCINGFCASGVQ